MNALVGRTTHELANLTRDGTVGGRFFCILCLVLLTNLSLDTNADPRNAMNALVGRTTHELANLTRDGTVGGDEHGCIGAYLKLCTPGDEQVGVHKYLKSIGGRRKAVGKAAYLPSR